MRRYVIMFKEIAGRERYDIVKAENVELAIGEIRKIYGYATIIKNIYSEEI